MKIFLCDMILVNLYRLTETGIPIDVFNDMKTYGYFYD